MAKQKTKKKAEKPVEKESIVFIDVKTSGTSKTQNGLTEIALLILNDKNREIGYYHTFVKPYNQEGSEKLINYNKKKLSESDLTTEKLEANGKDPLIVCEQLQQMFKKHNCTVVAGYDLKKHSMPWLEKFVDRFLPDNSIKFKKGTDVKDLAKKHVKGLINHDLGTICKYFQIEVEKTSNSLEDCRTAFEILKKLIQL